VRTLTSAEAQALAQEIAAGNAQKLGRASLVFAAERGKRRSLAEIYQVLEGTVRHTSACLRPTASFERRMTRPESEYWNQDSDRQSAESGYTAAWIAVRTPRCSAPAAKLRTTSA
jgi:hypothetical protein